jgi:hypothetical protein
MNSLLQRTLDAHGGLERWRRFEHVSAHLRNGGVLWALKQQQGVIDDVNVRVAVHRERASHSPFVEPTWRTSFEPHRVAIEWRRLQVTFPPDIATHGTVQTYYIGTDGLLKRHDYDTEVPGGTPAVHYVNDYRERSGILLPTSRKVLRRMPDGTAAPDPLIVTIALSDVEFT